VKVKISTANITTREGCEELIRSAIELGPVGGIFNLAVVLQDAAFKKQTSEKFIKCFKPKALSTKYLDEISRSICPEIDHFVAFSSVSSGRGQGGQSNYGMANSFTEKIMEKRHRDNLCGSAIQFACW
jgi:fatty acid synthase, animal type